MSRYRSESSQNVGGNSNSNSVDAWPGWVKKVVRGKPTVLEKPADACNHEPGAEYFVLPTTALDYDDHGDELLVAGRASNKVEDNNMNNTSTNNTSTGTDVVGAPGEDMLMKDHVGLGGVGAAAGGGAATTSTTVCANSA